jgi:large subunit ribosomal protein L22
MEAQATARYLGTGHRKVKAVLDLIRGKQVEEALGALRFIPRAASSMVEKALRSALANASNREAGLNLDKVRVLRCFANQGPLQRNAKRFIPRAMGRASAIHKRTCHLTIVVGDSKEKA